MHDNKRSFGFVFFFLLMFNWPGAVALWGQSAIPENQIEASFVRKSVLHQFGELTFNVVRIYNTSPEPVTIQPVLELPDSWSVFSNSLKKTSIAPGDSLHIPLRINIPSRFRAEKNKQVMFHAYSHENKLLASCSFLMTIETIHNWDVIVLDPRSFLLPNRKSVNVRVQILNSGNTTESIDIRLQPDRKLAIEGSGENEHDLRLILPPNSDTILHYKVFYQSRLDRVFDIGKIQIEATNGMSAVLRSIIVEKYTDSYSPFVIETDLLHSTELGLRSFSKNNNILPYIKAKGFTEFENSSNFRYNLTYYDLTEQENVISNSYYNFLYTKEELQVGLGAFSSRLGRNLYSRNSIMVSNKMKLGPGSSLEGFTSYGFIDNKANAALGYDFHINELPFKATASYSLDDTRGRNTTSVTLQSSRVPIGERQIFNFKLHAYHEENFLTTNYSQGGIAYDFNYFVQASPRLDFQVHNSYGSPDIPGSQMGLFNLQLKANYYPGDKKKSRFTAALSNIERNFRNYNLEGIQLPQIYLRSQYGNLFFHYTPGNVFRFNIGPSYELYYASKPLDKNGLRERFAIEKYRFELQAYYKRNLNLKVKYGLSNFDFMSPVSQVDSKYDLHIQSEFSMNGYGVSLNYDRGAMANHGLYQYATDSEINALSIAPRIMKTYWEGRIKLNLFANLMYRFDLNYNVLNINPRMEVYLGRNWFAVAGGTYSYTRYQHASYTFGRSHYYMEFAIRKNWGRSSGQKWKQNLNRLRVQLYKDENGNGIKESHETGLANVKVRVRLTNTAKMQEYKGMPVDITLVSNDKGIVTFDKLPTGFYEMQIIPLESVSEYFYIGHGAEKVELLRNRTLQIPFQKANRIEGRVDLTRQRFIKSNEQIIQLANIKVTAYTRTGNSYSAFTDAEGKFVIFVPGAQVYHVRINNVFGSNFRINNNDIRVSMPEMAGQAIDFHVVENNRTINFRRISKPDSDSTEINLQKIKVLKSSIAQIIADNTNHETVAKPMPYQDNTKQENYYVVLTEANDISETIRFRQIYSEQGLTVNFGYDEDKKAYYVYTNAYDSRQKAREELRRIESMGIRGAKVVKHD